MTLLSCTASPAGCLVTYCPAGSDEPETAELELEWQPEERDVGISAGWIAHGDAPEAVLSAAAEWASERARDDYDDREPESRDGAW